MISCRHHTQHQYYERRESETQTTQSRDMTRQGSLLPQTHGASAFVSQNFLARAEAVVNPLKLASYLLLFIAHNYLAVCHTVRASCRSSPSLLGRGCIQCSRNTPLPMCYRVELGRSRSNRMGLSRFNSKIHNVHLQYLVT